MNQSAKPAIINGIDEASGRAGLSLKAVERNFIEHLFYTQGRLVRNATLNDVYMAVAYTVRDQLLHRWVMSVRKLLDTDIRAVAYLSAEFLLGPHLEKNIVALGMEENIRKTLEAAGFDYHTILDQEEEPGLGNGGLGRLAACYLDSLATLQIPAIGYGIRYEFGIFDQRIHDGWQVETTDKWLRLGNPWEIPRPEITHEVKLGGSTQAYTDETGRYRVRWIPHHTVKGVAYDTPILGHGVNTCNLLRLWKAEAVESFDFDAFNLGDYYGAVHEKVYSENISRVLYPNDEPIQGKQLRLEQQYFFASCSLQNMLWMLTRFGDKPQNIAKRFAVQLNDTHPAIGVAELMRLLVDEYDMDWDEAWEITRSTFAYTNHTLLPEALEKWPLDLFGGLLPRHLEIIFEINRRFLDEVQALYPGDEARVARMSLIDETGPRYVRMANLATIGGMSVNGVSKLHSRLLEEGVLRDFHDMTPEKFNNKTNGVTPRRFMLLCNPRLSRLISERIGNNWVTHLEDLRRIEPFAEDVEFRNAWRAVKLENKRDLARIVYDRTGVELDPAALFDVQAKRIHEYKRQHLNVLHVVTLYNRLKRNPGAFVTPRAFLFGGKAAPGYWMAKLIIRLINGVAEVVNADPDVAGRLRVVFFPDFNVKNAQHIYPAADLSEQISMAGKEACGTGNMKFSMNGALTIGTLDGANIEIREEVGPENFFLFGLTAEEVQERWAEGYRPIQIADSTWELREALDTIGSGLFSRGDAGLFRPLVDSLLYHDEYMLLADYASYIEAQEKASLAYADAERWARMSILNVARIGKFSSDRAVREYCEEIWKVNAVPVDLFD